MSAPDHPGEGCRFLPSVKGPVTIQGVPDPCGGPGLRGGPDFHGTGPGPLLGEQGFWSAGVRPLDVVKDNYKALLA